MIETPENIASPTSVHSEPETTSESETFSGGEVRPSGKTTGEVTEKDINRLYQWLFGVTVFFAVFFVLAMLTIGFDIYRDNSLYDKFIEQVNISSDQYEKFTEKTTEKINESNKSVDSLRKEFELLRVKNQYLK